MEKIKSTRIESIDILRGLVMVIMALDHTRDYFFIGNSLGDPTDVATTTPVLFFTRFITHYCAPVFVFLAGTSAFLYGRKKTKNELFKFLFTRGVWLILLEIFLNNLIWRFNYDVIVFQVIWAIGFSMICLSFIIYLPKKAVLALGILIVAGHNLLDGIVMEDQSFKSIIWYLMHQPNFVFISDTFGFMFFYPALPWIGVMVLGYCFGQLYDKTYNQHKRRKWLLALGLGSIILFLAIRGINVYGDLVPWQQYETVTKTVLSFINVTKYPPSLLYVLITLGPAMLFLYGIETVKNKLTNFLLVFGRVPLFYYFLHVLVIHVAAIAGVLLFTENGQELLMQPDGLLMRSLSYHGYPLFVVYLVWIGVVLFLYPFCKKYMVFKANNKDKWWLSYL